ncbi:MBL fold metallo-hydrolase [Nocardiopsis halophila]|uniref:MBL fold metallo-hydrolase n=1 Tax=Nocardiopsis halophila TaxID=141692 RepID=UPI00034BDE0B|nr:MBL fold metallo-hydrolase [Nocardiopsis halophila]
MAGTGLPLPVRVIGGPTALITYGGLRLLTDPTFDPPGDHPAGEGIVLGKTAPPAATPAEIGPLDAVLLSHDEHPDNLDTSGRALLPEVPLTLTTVGGAERLGGTARGLAPWESTGLPLPGGGSATVTAVPALHGPDGAEEVLGEVIGFVLTGEGLPTVYVSGDNASLDLVRQVAGRFGPVDAAVLFAGAARAPFFDSTITLDSAQAAEAARILGARQVVPVHYEGWTHFTEGREELEKAFAAAGLSGRLAPA